MDLRRTCITELGETGASDDELVLVSGHQDRQMLSICSLASYRKALAAMRARWADRENESAPTEDEGRVQGERGDQMDPPRGPKTGADARIRTADLLITNQLLYH
jgi:hypothetical protein